MPPFAAGPPDHNRTRPQARGSSLSHSGIDLLFRDVSGNLTNNVTSRAYAFTLFSAKSWSETPPSAP
ncbi:hypothetical protein [Embleya sp. NPDC020630]|uniref:hypothetical protein n=1 Tax=Embleya sp. NPDC020630 TaxID=3363979 RepID=UPI00379ABCE2